MSVVVYLYNEIDFLERGKKQEKNQMTTLQTGCLDPFRPIVLFMGAIFSLVWSKKRVSNCHCNTS